MTAASEVRSARAQTVQDEIENAISRIRFGSIVIQIQDGAVVQIETTEKKRFPVSPPPQRSTR